MCIQLHMADDSLLMITANTLAKVQIKINEV